MPAAVAFLLVAIGGSGSAAAACSNEARRAEQGATGLPDCRAFELVTPGATVGKQRIARAAVGGGALTYFTNHPSPGADTSAYFYLAKRGSDGWSTQNIGPQNAAAAQFGAICEQNVFFSPDFSRYVLEAGWFEAGEPSRCKRTEEPIVPGEPVPYRNLFLRDLGDGSTRLLNLTPATATPANAELEDAADDLSRVVFAEEAKLTPEAPAGYAFYLWHDGELRLVTFLPDGTPAAGELVEATRHYNGSTYVEGSGFAPFTGATSADGRRLFFYSGDGLYLRRNADQPQSATLAGECLEPALACTVQVDASQGPGASGGGVFWRASDDASTVFFSADRKLTADSTAVSGKPDLYRYDVGSGQLTDLTVDAGGAADVRGVVGMSAGGDHLYFVANGALAPGASAGSCDGIFKTTGQCSLYLLHDGSISLIGRLSGKEPWVWQEFFENTKPREKGNTLWANVSPNGRYLAFLSSESLTGYDNYDAKSEINDRELFLYDAEGNAGAGDLACLSCPPGTPENPYQELATAWNYGPNAGSNPSWVQRAVLDDGTVFFDTESPLLAADTNEAEDVYEYADGALHLISPGDFAGGAFFLDAAPDGSEVFFRTAQSLVGRDSDSENVSIYDARVGGGFAEPPPPPAACEGDACHPPSPPPPALPSPGTDGAAPPPVKPKPCKNRRSGRRCAKKHRRGGRRGHHRRKRVER